MERREVGRYTHPESHGWAGWLHPERAAGHKFPDWCLFVHTDGRVALGIAADAEGQCGLEFTGEFGADHPRTFTREPGETPA